MIHRTIVAALLIGWACTSHAAGFASRTYDQAAGLSSGKTSANLAYDGSVMKTIEPVNVPPGGVKQDVSAPMTPKPATHKEDVPSPSRVDGEHHLPPIGTVDNTVIGAGLGGIVGFAAGFALSGGNPAGGAAGALIGIAIGGALGFFLSKRLAS